MRRRNWKESNIYLFITPVLLFFCILSVVAQPANFPVPPASPNHLFYLQRTPNTNTIICDLNLINGHPDPDNPVHVYWIRYQENGQKAELNYIQRKFAYGMKSRKLGENNYELNFVSYKKYKMQLKTGNDGKYHVFSKINQREIILTRLYLAINGGTFWSPNVEYLQVSGVDPVTRQVLQEKIRL